jgi:hypothetical protein
MSKTKEVLVQEQYKVSGLALPISPEEAGNALMRIYRKNENQLTPKQVVKEATRETHPLHSCFEWNDEKAGKKWRIHQAGRLISCLVVTKIDGKGEERQVKAFISVKEDITGNFTKNPFMPAKSYYVTVEDALTDKELRKYTVDVALFDLKNWIAKYESVKELAGLFDIIEEYIKKSK